MLYQINLFKNQSNKYYLGIKPCPSNTKPTGAEKYMNLYPAMKQTYSAHILTHPQLNPSETNPKEFNNNIHYLYTVFTPSESPWYYTGRHIYLHYPVNLMYCTLERLVEALLEKKDYIAIPWDEDYEEFMNRLYFVGPKKGFDNEIALQYATPRLEIDGQNVRLAVDASYSKPHDAYIKYLTYVADIGKKTNQKDKPDSLIVCGYPSDKGKEEYLTVNRIKHWVIMRLEDYLSNLLVVSDLESKKNSIFNESMNDDEIEISDRCEHDRCEHDGCKHDGEIKCTDKLGPEPDENVITPDESESDENVIIPCCFDCDTPYDEW